MSNKPMIIVFFILVVASVVFFVFARETATASETSNEIGDDMTTDGTVTQ